jgi:NTP pyrophosphatase (non-canonical NTP hydrolase)
MSNGEIISRLNEAIENTDDSAAAGAMREAADALRRADDRAYAARVASFHDTLREESGEDYLTVRAAGFDEGSLGATPDTPAEAVAQMAELKAERNRLFWSSFLSEESGEVSKALNDGESAEAFQDEVVDVMVICFAIADVFGFDIREVFDRVMAENEGKPKSQNGTGKLRAEAREEWRDD